VKIQKQMPGFRGGAVAARQANAVQQINPAGPVFPQIPIRPSRSVPTLERPPGARFQAIRCRATYNSALHKFEMSTPNPPQTPIPS
jgi:hypothetical protein